MSYKQELWLNVQLSAVTAAQVLVSIAMQWYLVSHFGAGIEADALYAGSTFSLIGTTLILETMRVVLTPLLCQKSENDLKESAMQFLILALGGVGLVAMLLYPAIPLLVPALVPGFSVAGKQLTVELARIQLSGLFGGAIYAVFATVSVVRRRFLQPGLATLFSAIICFLLLLWKLKTWSVLGAAWILSAYVILPGILLVPTFGKPAKIAWSASELRGFWTQLRPLIAARAYFLTSIPLDRLLISFLPAGSITVYELAGRVSGVLLRILDVGTVTPALPRLARLAQSEAWTDFRKLTFQKARECLLISFVFLGAGLAALAAYRAAVPWGILPTHLGKLGVNDLSRIGTIVVYMGAILPFMSIIQVFSGAYCARKDTGTLTKLGAIVYTAAIPVRILGFLGGGIQGIVFSTGLTGAVHCVLLKRYLRPKRLQPSDKSGLPPPQAEVVTALADHSNS